MPIKDLAQKREYFKKYMAIKRAKKRGLTNYPVTGLTGKKPTMGLTTELGFPKAPSVKPEAIVLNPVKPKLGENVKPEPALLNPENVKPSPVQILPQPDGTTKIIFANLQVCLDWINKH